jgi:hypothetical protein
MAYRRRFRRRRFGSPRRRVSFRRRGRAGFPRRRRSRGRGRYITIGHRM